jgi:hypothetical protein
VLWGAQGFSQPFDVSAPLPWKSFPFFSPEYCAKNHIKAIRTEVMKKPSNRPIMRMANRDFYYFDTLGTITSRWSKTIHFDTTLWSFETDGRKLLVWEYSSDSRGRRSFRYIRDENGNVTEVIERDEKKLEVVGTEKFRYDYDYEGQYKKYWLNDEGLSYKYALVKVDSENRKIHEEHRFIRGAGKIERTYVYQNEWLIEYREMVRTTSRSDVAYQMKYNSLNQIIEMDEIQGGTPVFHTEFLYENGLVTAILEKELATQEITITKFSYEFYP